MARLGKLNIELGLIAKGLNTGLKKASSTLSGFSKRVESLGKSTGAFAAKAATPVAAVGAAATAAGAALAYVTKEQINLIGDQADAAKKLGTTRNALLTIQRAAKGVGIESVAVTASMEKMSDLLGSAFRGDSGAVTTLEKLGLQIKELRTLSPEQQFMRIGQAIDGIDDPAQKIAAARDIFGKQGGNLVNLFAGGSAAISDAAAELGNLGVLLSDLDLHGVEKAGDAFDAMGTLMEGITTQLSKEVSPVIVQISKDSMAWLESIGGVEAAVGKGLDWLGKKLDWISEKIRVMSAWWDSMKEGADVIADAIPDFIKKGGAGGMAASWIGEKIVGAGQNDIASRVEAGTGEPTFVDSVKDYIAEAKAANAKSYREEAKQAKRVSDIADERLNAEKAVTKEVEKQTKEIKKQKGINSAGQGALALIAFNGVGSEPVRGGATKDKAVEAEKRPADTKAVGTLAAKSLSSGPKAIAASSEQEMPPAASAAANVAGDWGSKNFWQRELFGGEVGKKYDEKRINPDRKERKYWNKIPGFQKDYEAKMGQSMLPAAEQDPFAKPGYADKMGPSMQKAANADPVGKAKANDSASDMQETNMLLREVRDSLRGGVPARYA